jgi:hypothetical protein
VKVISLHFHFIKIGRTFNTHESKEQQSLLHSNNFRTANQNSNNPTEVGIANSTASTGSAVSVAHETCVLKCRFSVGWNFSVCSRSAIAVSSCCCNSVILAFVISRAFPNRVSDCNPARFEEEE